MKGEKISTKGIHEEHEEKKSYPRRGTKDHEGVGEGSSGIRQRSGRGLSLKVLRARVQTRNILDTLNRKQGLHPAKRCRQGAICRPQKSLPPGGGVGETRAEPAAEPVGALSPPRELQGLFTSMDRTYRIAFASPASRNPGHHLNELLTSMDRMHRIWFQESGVL